MANPESPRKDTDVWKTIAVFLAGALLSGIMAYLTKPESMGRDDVRNEIAVHPVVIGLGKDFDNLQDRVKKLEDASP